MKSLTAYFALTLVSALGSAVSLPGLAEGLRLSSEKASQPPLLAQAAPTEDAVEKDVVETPAAGPGFTGFIQAEVAHTYASPAHWSKGLLRVQLGHQGNLGWGLKYKISGRFDYDAVYDNSNFYPHDVKNDQRGDFQVRETYIDGTAGDFEFRVGRQHIVWGEMVGLFFADVVSAKDLREFVLPDFEVLRIPQWAARAEYFKDDFHAEFILIPYASYDNIGKPGADFYPTPPAAAGVPFTVLGDEQPKHSFSNSNYGLRLSTIKEGWDVAGFMYRSFDASPTFYRDDTFPSLVYRLRHDRITQTGATLAKDLGSFVLKAEGVYTHGRKSFTADPSAPNGLIPQNTFLYVVGLEFSLPNDTNFNVQLFDNVTLDRDPNVFLDSHETGTTLYLKRKFNSEWEAEALFLRSLNRADWLFRPKVAWAVEKNWRFTFGADIFDGSPEGFFGRFRNRDRLYSELRYSF